jgi:hypothetical protein
MSQGNQGARPTRCLLFAHPDEFVSANQRALEEHLATAFARRPPLAIGVDAEKISVIDLAGDVVLVSTPLAQVTATPETYNSGNSTAESDTRRCSWARGWRSSW